MTSSQLAAEVVAEIERMRRDGELEVEVEPRCHVCCEVESRDLVNKLLAAGFTNREVTECLAGVNRRRQESGDRRLITARLVYEHRRNHFNVDKPAQAVYRSILERRAEEAGRDYINGVAHAVTPYAAIETALVKGYDHLTDEETVVGVREMIAAAVKLHEMTSSDSSQRRMAEMHYMMDRIIRAAREFIPASRHQEFLSRVEGGDEPVRQLTPPTAPPVLREFTPSVTDEDAL